MGRGSNLQLSCYLMLTLAAICLTFADAFFLSWMPWFLGGMLIAFVAAWRNEGKRHLSEPAANTLGLFIGFGMLWWIIFQLPRSEEDLLAAGVPWPAGMLPHLGPLLMILTAVKLFRPKKIADFWGLQVLGVMMVTLASVLAGEIEHGFWILLYLVSAVWCLINFERMKGVWAKLDDAQRAEVSLFAADTTTAAGGSRHMGKGLLAASVWSVVIAACGGLLFILAPRHSSVQWVPHKLSTAISGRIMSGFDGGMDLNRTGKVELSDEIAFEATPLDASGNIAKLSPSMYWRGETLEFYQNGRWHTATSSSDALLDFAEDKGDPLESSGVQVLWTPDSQRTHHPADRPTEVPADKTYLTIHTLPTMAGGLVLAEPLDIEAGVGLFPYSGGRASRSALFAYFDGADTIVSQGRRSTYQYGQVIDPAASATAQKARRIYNHYRRAMLSQRPRDELIRWSGQLVARVSGLSDAERTLDAEGTTAPAHRAKVAQAIARHFAYSGEYLYSLNRRRVDTTIDPNLDFLQNVKEGHCERYASGLALTLRSLGIPCRIARGFVGSDASDDGIIRVRLNQAHSWVQALVPRSDESGYDWILLDPTPSQQVAITRWQLAFEWINNSLRSARLLFRSNVLEYGNEQQSTHLRAWWDRLRNSPWAIALTALIPTIIGLASLQRFARAPLTRWWHARTAARLERQRMPWLADALAIVASKTGQRPEASQTLREFVASLNGGPFTALAAPLNVLVTHADRVRFGEQPISTADQTEISLRLADLYRHPPT